MRLSVFVKKVNYKLSWLQKKLKNRKRGHPKGLETRKRRIQTQKLTIVVLISGGSIINALLHYYCMMQVTRHEKSWAHEDGRRGKRIADWKWHISELAFHFLSWDFLFLNFFFSLVSNNHNKICPYEGEESVIKGDFFFFFKLTKRPRLLKTWLELLYAWGVSTVCSYPGGIRVQRGRTPRLTLPR